MRKSKFILYLLVAFLIFIIPTLLGDSIKVVINGHAVDFYQEGSLPFIDENSRTLAPLRVTLESFGAKVRWDAANNTAIIEKDDVRLDIPIGSLTIYKNGESITVESAALIKDGHTYIPIRSVMEAFECSVNWNENEKTVYVTSDNTSFSANVTNVNSIQVHYLDVGQADCIFIDIGDFDILIDGGNNDDGDLIVDYLEALHTDDIEIMVATHNHEDHIGGLDTILEAFVVEKVIHSGEDSNTRTYKDFMAVAIKEGCQIINDENLTFHIGETITFNVLEIGDEFKNTNDNSVICKLDHGSVSFLFTGDAEHQAEEALIKTGVNLDVDVFKAGHHGSDTANTEAFLNRVTPKYVIISCGKDNTYGHPHKGAIAQFFKHTKNVYTTMNNGHITVTSNGTSVLVDSHLKPIEKK